MIVNKIKEHHSAQTNPSGYGYNARTDTFGDLFEEGVIDPTKVSRVALQNAASVASLLLTTEATIVDKPNEKQNQHPQRLPCDFEQGDNVVNWHDRRPARLACFGEKFPNGSDDENQNC